MPIALYALIALAILYCGLSQLVAWPICTIVALALAIGIAKDAKILRRSKSTFHQENGEGLRVHDKAASPLLGYFESWRRLGPSQTGRFKQLFQLSSPLDAIGFADTLPAPSDTLTPAAKNKKQTTNNDPKPSVHQRTDDSKQKAKSKASWGENALAVLCLVSILGVDIAQGGPINTWMLRLSLDIVLALLAYRAIVHHSRAQKMQTAILTLIPLVALAQVIQPTLFLTIIATYSLVFWRFSKDIALTPPSTGASALAFIDGATKHSDQSKKNWPIAWLPRLATLILVITAIALAFFLMPRWGGATRAQVPNTAPQGQYPPQMALDKTGDIQLDPSLIFTAELPKTQQLNYWRFEVQESFDGIRWQDIPKPRTTKKPKAVQKQGPYTLEFIREWRDQRVPSLANTVDIQWTNTREKNTRAPFKRDTQGIWYQGRQRARTSHYAYAIYLDPTLEKRQYPPQKRKHKTIWPFLNEQAPRIQNLAKELTSHTDNNGQKAQKIQQFLNKNYSYSLKRPKRNGPIVEDFLFSQKFGHCEVFSTTMAVLLASLDVPVRHVTGFMSSEYRGELNYVRATHAHSWVEIYDEVNRHWQRFDPTPASEQAKISWLVLVNDAFSRYKSRPLYQWIGKHYPAIATTLAALLSLLALFGASFACLGLKRPKSALLLIFLGMATSTSTIFVLLDTFELSYLPLLAITASLASLALVSPWLWASFKDLDPLWTSVYQQLIDAAKRQPQNQEWAKKSLGELWLYDFAPQNLAFESFLKDYLSARYIPSQKQKRSWRSKLAQVIHIHCLGIKAMKALRDKSTNG